MRRVVIAGVALGCLAVFGCGPSESVIKIYQRDYSQMHSLTLCKILTEKSRTDDEIIAATRVLRTRGEDCKDY